MRSKKNALVGSLGALILIAPFFFAQTSNGGAGKNETRPTPVGQEEVRDHRVGESPFLRISLPPREAAELGMEGIAVHLTVDTNGAVTSASPDNGVSADLRSGLREK